MSFLNVSGKNYLITGVANKKSIAFFVARILSEEGANLFFSVQSEVQQAKVQELFPGRPVYLCDVVSDEQIKSLAGHLKNDVSELHGLLHSIAFANLKDGIRPFHETSWEDFSQASHVSLYSLVGLARHLKELFHPSASVVALSISNTRATNYGYLGPIKAALDSAVAFLSKSFSSFSEVRFNALCAGPLKTSASAGIPGYVKNYLFAEKLTLRKRALATEEVANAAVFLLSERSSGITASSMIIDAGMSANYFDESVVEKTML
ncbi:MAG: enoyl-ACP reductase [Bdellovibrionales bacterium GWA2_49_15]|nr:MAG: enoyl-ACP reductase [Bdellovibrionales bacterium GWA2_49_15]